MYFLDKKVLENKQNIQKPMLLTIHIFSLFSKLVEEMGMAHAPQTPTGSRTSAGREGFHWYFTWQ